MRFTVRALLRARIFAATVIATLGVGVGANVALFQMLRQMLHTAPSGVEHPERLRRIRHTFLIPGTREHKTRQAFSFAEYRELKGALPSSTSLIAFSQRQMSVAENGEEHSIHATQVAGDYFGTLGVRPAIGRFFDTTEVDEGVPVAVVSDDLWRREFGASPAVLGRALRVNGDLVTVR